MSAPLQDMVLPGDELGKSAEYDAGTGTYERNGSLRASIIGRKIVLPVTNVVGSAQRGTVAVVADTVKFQKVDIGSLVLCKVVRINTLAAYVDILIVDGLALGTPYAGLIRKENVREVEVDKVRMEECFCPGDVVQARVASLGDAKSYFLTTAEPSLGVVTAMSESGAPMHVLSFDSMEDGVGVREKRKVARPEAVA